MHKKPDGSIDMIHAPQKKMLGVQFHPESVMTEHGRDILRNMLIKLIK
jgi:anthranilate/para-aminobenzoate synthase component II